MQKFACNVIAHYAVINMAHFTGKCSERKRTTMYVRTKPPQKNPLPNIVLGTFLPGNVEAVRCGNRE